MVLYSETHFLQVPVGAKSILYTFFHFSQPKKGVNLLLLKKKNILILSIVTHHNISQLTHKYKNTTKDVLVSIKPKFSDKFFNFYEKNSYFTIFRKVQIILKITKKKWNSVSLYL